MVKRLKKFGLFSIVISLVLIFQLIPINNANAITPSDLTGSVYLTEHGTDYLPIEKASSLIITEADGLTIISPDVNGNYNNIPAGAKIQLVYAFTLEDGSGGALYDYDGNEFFTVSLPDGLDFAAINGTIVANDTVDGNYDLAHWNIAGNIMQVDLTKASEDTFGKGGAANDSHLNKWGKIEIDGEFTPLSAGDDTRQEITFGTQTIVINRQPLPMESSLEKTSSYDAAANEITWTVTVKPPAGDPNLAFNEYKLIDEFSVNQTYVAESFTSQGNAIADISLDLTDLASGKISYVFPDAPPELQGVQTITYKTKPSDFAAEVGGGGAEFSTYDNTANLLRGTDVAADPVTDSLNLNWINKTGIVVDKFATDPTIVKWEVDVTVPGTSGKSITGAEIIDQLSPDLELFVDGTHHVSIEFAGGPKTTVNAGTNAGEYDYVGDVLTYRFPVGEQPVAGTKATLVFYTKVKAASWDSFLDSNSAIEFTNRASLNWNENTTGTTPSDSNTISSGIGSGGLLAKSAGSSTTYKYSSSDPGTIHWTTTVNRNKINIKNGKIVDIIPNDQELFIDASHPFVVKKVQGNVTVTNIITPASSGNFTYTDANHFTYAFSEETLGSETISSTYTIDYYTKVVNPTGLVKLYKNGNVVFNNGATLVRDGNDISVTGSKTYSSQMLTKKVATAYNYDPAERTVKWEVVVNRNELPLNNAVLTDNLPPGMTLLIDTTHPFEVVAAGGGGLGILAGTSGDSSFTYTLPALTSDKYTITFWSKMDESALTTQWSGTKNFTNQAKLDSDEIGTPISASASAKIINPVLDKTYDYTAGHDTIEWSVIINPAQTLMSEGIIKDVINSSLQLDVSTLKLYEVTINSTTGKANPGGILVDPLTYTVDLPTVANGNELTVELPKLTSSAYRLDFNTAILNDDIDLSNTVSLSGKAGDPGGSSNSNQIVVNNLYSGGGSGTNTLTVHKTNASGDPLTGAKFRLLNVNKDAITRSGNEVIETTDALGDAVFDNLPSWVFFVEEIDPAPGYLISANPIYGGNRLSGTETINVTNELALTDVSFNKTGANGALLTGGTFTLTGKDYALNDVNLTAPAVNGVVTFSNISPNQTGVPYTITETVAPGGHVTIGLTISATVDYNTSKQGLEVTFTPNGNMVNTPETANVTFTKTGTGGALLSGGSFTLSGTDYAGNAVNISGVAAVGGLVAFTNLPIGSYTVTEITPPAGYLMPADPNILTITVAYNAGNNLIVSTNSASAYENIEALGSLSFTKNDTADSSLVSGGTFTLTGKDYAGNDITMSATSIGGTVSFNNVPIGNDYTIKETISPPGYLLTSTELKASVSYSVDKQTVVTSISDTKLSNKRAPLISFGKLEVIKTDERGNNLEGAEFGLYDVYGNKLYTAITAADGVAKFMNIPYGNYVLEETKAPTGYVLDKKKISVEVKDSEKISFTYVNKKQVTPKVGRLRIAKVDREYFPLAGAEFTLYDSAGKIIKRLVTGSNGIVIFDGLDLGKYTIKETKAPDEYVLVEGVLEIQISSTTLNQSYTLVNDKQDKPGVVGGWTDEELPQTGGVPFSLYLLMLGVGLVGSGLILRRLALHKS